MEGEWQMLGFMSDGVDLGFAVEVDGGCVWIGEDGAL